MQVIQYSALHKKQLANLPKLPPLADYVLRFEEVKANKQAMFKPVYRKRRFSVN